jgi:hypothetical protein
LGEFAIRESSCSNAAPPAPYASAPKGGKHQSFRRGIRTDAPQALILGIQVLWKKLHDIRFKAMELV